MALKWPISSSAGNGRSSKPSVGRVAQARAGPPLALVATNVRTRTPGAAAGQGRPCRRPSTDQRRRVVRKRCSRLVLIQSVVQKVQEFAPAQLNGLGMAFGELRACALSDCDHRNVPCGARALLGCERRWLASVAGIFAAPNPGDSVGFGLAGVPVRQGYGTARVGGRVQEDQPIEVVEALGRELAVGGVQRAP